MLENKTTQQMEVALKKAQLQISSLKKKIKNMVSQNSEGGESSKTFLLIFQNHPMPMWVIDKKTLAFLQVNDAAIQKYGYSQAEFQSLTLKNIHSPEDIEVLTSYLKGKKSKLDFPEEQRHVLKNGNFINVEVTSRNLDFQGHQSVLIIVQDITARKEAEKALQKRETSLQGILQSTADGILAVGSEKEVLFANEQFYKMWKISQEVISTKDEATLLNFVLDQLKDPQVFLQKVQSLYKTKDESYDTLYFKDGKIFERRSKPIINDNILEGRVWSFHDVTETKVIEKALNQSESKYRTLHNTMTDGFVSATMQGRILETNKAYQEMTGYSMEELTTLTYFELTPQKWHGFENHIVETQTLPNGLSEVYEKEYIKKDGTIFPVEIYNFLTKNEAGENEGIWAIVRDITERKKAEEAIKKSEVHYHSLFEDLPIALWEENFSAVQQRLDTLREQGVTNFREYFDLHPEEVLECAALVKIIDVNNATIELFETRSKGDLTANLAEQIKDEPIRQFKIELINIAEGNTKFGWEGAVKTISGYLKNIDLTWYAVPNTEKPLSRVIVSMIDTTDRKQAEKALIKNEERFRSLIANAADLIIVIDAIGTIKFVTPSSEVMLGYTPEEAIGKNFLNWVHPDDLASTVEALTSRSNTPGTAPASMKVRTLHKDGSWRVLDGIGTNMFAEPSVQGIIINIRDVTEREQIEEERRRNETALRESEAQYRLLADNMNDIIWLMDINLKTIYASPSTLRKQGYTLEELNSIPFEKQLTPASLKQAQNLYEKVLSPENISSTEPLLNFTIELEFYKKDGSTYWSENSFTLVLDKDGKPANIISNGRDITERKRAEVENKYQLAELEALYESGLTISRLIEPKQIAQRMVEVLAQKLNWHHVAIRLYDAKNNRLELLALNSTGFTEAEIKEQIEKINKTINTPDKGLSGWVIKQKKVTRIGKLSNDPRYIETYKGINSGLYVPIQNGDEVIGSIAVESERENAFTERDANTLVTLANQAAISFINARLYLKVQDELDERHRVEDEIRKLNSSLEQRVLERTAQIESTKRRFEIATHAGQIGVWEYNLRENKVIWDERMQIIYHVPQGEFDGTYQSWAKLIHPDDIGKSQVNIQLAITQSLLLSSEFRIIWPDGTIRYIASSALTVFAADETPDRIIGINMDITERKNIEKSLRESENYARLLFNAVPDPISVVNIDGHVEDVNYAFEKQFNISRAEIQGKKISDFNIYSKEEQKKRIAYISEILKSDRVKSIQLNFNTPDEEVHTLELHSYPIEVKGKQLILNASRDITTYKKAEDTLQLANIEMQHALRIKDEFLANMSHELRTPLNAILGISESLEEQITGTLNEKQIKYVRIINESGQHLLELINDILDLSKIEAGKLELNIQPFSVQNLCTSSLRLVKELAQKKSLNVLFELDENVNNILGDERRLKQSLVNLLSNAVKFTPEGKEIGLSVLGNTTTNEVTFTVWDQGIGIDKKDINRLFKPFVQLDTGLAREYSGTGLGLAIVSQLVRLHGGHISMESELGKGSQFKIILPWAEQVINAEAEIISQVVPINLKLSEKRNIKILLVEDTEVVITLTGDYLRYKGYEVLIARNGMEGVLLAKEAIPDIILMDIMMPVMDGLEATKLIRKDPALQNTIIIALTALAMPGDREQCFAAGVNDYMSKPIQMPDLAKTIESHLIAKQEK